MISNPSLEFTVEDFVQSLKDLSKTAAPKATKVAYAEAVNNPRFTRANLGMFKDNSDGSIWKLQTAEDGRQYIVKTDLDDVIRQGHWSILPSRTGESVTVAYASTPVQCFAAKEFGFEKQHASAFAEILSDRLKANEQEFAKALVQTVPSERRAALQKSFSIFR